MQNAIVQKYIGELKKAQKPFLTTENQVVSGHIALAVDPSVDCDQVHSFRIDFPAVLQPTDSIYWMLFLVSVFDGQTACDILPRMKPAIAATGEFSEIIRGWRLRMFTEDGHRVISAEANCPAST